MQTRTAVVAIAAWVGIVGCGEEAGPKIYVDLNVRHLCQFGVTADRGGINVRCESHQDCCTQQDVDNQICDFREYCWTDGTPDYLQMGFCRQCEDDGNCSGGFRCDNRWCHKPCDEEQDCQDQPNTYCTGGFCRKPHVSGTEISFENKGNRDLEVYLNQTKLFGNQDACAFSRLQWSVPSDQQGMDTIILAPGQSDLFLSVQYSPPQADEVYYGYLEVHSNAINIEPLLLIFCGDAWEAPCSTDVDGDCPPCSSCTFDDFAELIEQAPEPNCEGYFF